MSNLQDLFQNNQQEEQNFDIKELLYKYLNFWPWYIFSLIVLLTIGFMYIRYQPNIYEASASVLIKTDKGGMFSDLASTEMMFAQKDKMEDEILIIKSLPVMTKVVNELKLNITYSRETNLSKRLLPYYKNNPIEVEFISTDPNSSYSFKIEKIDHQTFLLLKDNQENKYKYNQRISIDAQSSIIVRKTEEFKSFQDEIFVVLNSPDIAAINILNNLIIEPASKESNAIALRYKSTSLEQAKDILNEIIKQYFQNTISDKRMTLVNTSDFIKERILLLDTELKSIENQIKIYKQTNKLTDLVTEATMFSSNVQQINEQMFDTELKLNLVKSLNNRLSKNTNETLPANLGLEDQTISESIANYNELVLNIKNLSTSVTELNPERQLLNKQLKEAKRSIEQSLINQQKILEMTLGNIKGQSNKIDSKLRDVPAQEKDIREIDRQQKTKEALFLYLLQKKEELAITETSLEPNARLLNYAFGSKIPVAPKKSIILLVFLFTGLILPTLFVYIKDLLDTKLHTIEQLEKISQLPNMGLIPNHQSPNRIILDLNDRSTTAEALRLIITNTEFALADVTKSKTILLTSTFAGEGKSFIAANTASYLAFSGKKTILLGFDLRAPKINEFFNYNNTNGLTHFIKNQNLSIDNIITKIPDYDNKLDIIHAGVTVPNFVELLRNSRIEELFTYLKENYDYIIIDSAPVGLVSDTLNLSKYVDMCLYVFRAHQFEKNAIIISNKLFKENKLNRMYSILNGADLTNKTYGYGYGKMYGYGYGYGESKPDYSSFKYKFWHINFYKNILHKFS